MSIYSTADLPYGMPPHTLSHLQKARIGSRMLRIRKETHPPARKGVNDKEGEKGEGRGAASLQGQDTERRK